MNGNFDFVFQGVNRLWMVTITLIFNGSPQKMVQWGQITAPRRPIDIRISADYLIFKNSTLDDHEASGLYAKFSLEQCEEFSVPENDGELMLMDVQAHSGQ